MTTPLLLAPVSPERFPSVEELFLRAHEGEKAVLEVAIPLVGALRAAGGSPFFVGGYVRDVLLGISSKDIDIEVYGLQAQEVKRIVSLHGEVKEVGEAFGILKLVSPAGDIDVSLPRTESQIGAGHKGFAVQADPFLPMQEAMRRRDFTVNALLADVFTGEVFDGFDGVGDLRAGVLRAVDAEHFVEDPLRVLRAVQFASRLQFSLEPSTKTLIRLLVPRLGELSKERFYGEWQKLLLRSTEPSVGLRLMRELGIASWMYPDVQDIGSGAWEALTRRIDRAASMLQDPSIAQEEAEELLFACVCLALSDGGARFLESLQAPHAYTVRLPRLSQAFPEAKRFWQERQRIFETPGGAQAFLRRLARHVYPASLAQLVVLLRFDGWGEAAEHLRDAAQSVGVLEGVPEPLISGAMWVQYGVRPGPHMRDLIALSDQLRDEKNYDSVSLLARLPQGETDPSILLSLLRHLLTE